MRKEYSNPSQVIFFSKLTDIKDQENNSNLAIKPEFRYI